MKDNSFLNSKISSCIFSISQEESRKRIFNQQRIDIVTILFHNRYRKPNLNSVFHEKIFASEQPSEMSVVCD